MSNISSLKDKHGSDFYNFCVKEGYTTRDKKKINIKSLPGGDIKQSLRLSIEKDEDLSKLIKKYNEYSNDYGIKFNLMEIPRSDANLVRIDLDFKKLIEDKSNNDNGVNIKESETEHIYTRSDIKAFINIYCEHLNDYIDINGKNYCFTIMEKKNAKIINNEIKDGVHIMCPDICINNTVLLELRSKVVNDEKFKELVNKKMGLTNYPEDIFDKAPITSNAWFLLKSGKPNDDIYMPTFTYKLSIKEGDVKLKQTTLDMNDDDLVLHFSNYGKTENVSYKINIDSLTNNNNNINLGIKCASCSFKIDDCKCSRKIVKPEKIENIKVLVSCLNDHRADDYHKWCAIGMILYNISNSLDLFNIYDEFSKRSAKYDSEGVKLKWFTEFPTTSKKYNLGFPQLRKYAIEDNKTKALNLLDEEKTKFIKRFVYRLKRTCYSEKHKSLKVPDATFAKFIANYIKNYSDMLVICVDVKKNIWYKYENHRWQRDEDSNKLYMFLTEEMTEIIHKFTQNVQTEINERERKLKCGNKNDSMADDEEIDNLEDKIKKLESEVIISKKIIERLEDNTGRGKLIKDLCNECYDKTFINNLDNNPFVFVCKDCVLSSEFDKDGKFALDIRDGRPEDMVSYFSNISLKDILHNEINKTVEYYETIEDINDFLEKTHPDIEVREYFLNLLAESLFGIIRREEFFVWSSPNTNGGGGKSQMLEFIKLIYNGYGNNPIGYYTEINTKILQEDKTDPNAANPAIMSIKGRRIIAGNEIDPKKPLNTNIIKNFGGKGDITGRGLFEGQQTFKKQGKFMLACNYVPPVDQTGEAFWRRFIFLPFMSKFVEENDSRLKKPEIFKYHYERDYEIDEKIKRWAGYFLIMLWNRYKTLVSSGFRQLDAVNHPQEVKKQSEEYKENSSPVEKFIKLVVIKDYSYVTTTHDIKMAFKKYMSFNDKSSGSQMKKRDDELMGILKSTFGSESKVKIDRSGFKDSVYGKGKTVNRCFVGFRINNEAMDNMEQNENI